MSKDTSDRISTLASGYIGINPSYQTPGNVPHRPEIQIPSPLRPGSRVGVIAPASAPRDLGVFEKGVDALRTDGFEVVRFRETIEPHGYLAGSDEVRADELNHFLRRTDVDALFCVRGGYGSTRLLDRLDYEAATAHPKWLIGYSDITALHMALYVRSGWPGISGPIVTEWADWKPRYKQQFFSLVDGSSNVVFENPEPLRALVHGSASGRLLGGNLSVFAKLIGTPWMPDLTGAILFLEDLGEEPYRIDGLLAQLRHAGHLNRLGGVMLGQFTDADGDRGSPMDPGKPTLTMEQVFPDYFGALGIPVAGNLAYGHIPDRLSIPIGMVADLFVSENKVRCTLSGWDST